jgi:hypothetical protein
VVVDRWSRDGVDVLTLSSNSFFLWNGSGTRSIRLRIIHVRYDWLKVVTNPCIIISYLTSGSRVEAV